MLNNAIPIISDVPGKHLNPLLLAQSQWNDSEGFMMISYMQQSQASGMSRSRFYDLFFLRGSHIFECARMNPDLRTQLELATALRTFQRSGREDATRVFLFAAVTDTLNRFRSTFHHEPCLKVQMRGLSLKQIHNLLVGTKCERGIIECNEFVDLVPSIDLKDISSPEVIAQYRPPFKRGRILVYDIEGSRGLFGEGSDSDSSNAGTLTGNQSLKPGGASRPDDDSLGAPSGNQFSANDEKEAEEFTEFITRFLKSTPSDATSEGGATKSTKRDPRVGDGQSNEGESLQPNLFVVTHREGNPHQAERNLSPCPPPQGRVQSIPRKPRRNRLSSQAQAADATHPSEDSMEFIRVFERLFRSFRQHVFDVYGGKSDSIIADAVCRCQHSNPEFDVQNLSEETAIAVLDVIEHIANEALFLKRSRLRQGVLTLAADLYNKQYELLEKNHAIDRVEQFYYRLKK